MTCMKPDSAATAVRREDGLDFNPYEAMRPRAPGAIPQTARNGARVKANDVAPEGVYRPDYNILTPHMRSPDYVQMSTAAAITLGVMRGRMYRCSCSRCLNLLLTYPEGCRANCAYCGLARHREAERDYADRNFIRVDWPAVPMEQVVDIVAAVRSTMPTSSRIARCSAFWIGDHQRRSHSCSRSSTPYFATSAAFDSYQWGRSHSPAV